MDEYEDDKKKPTRKAIIDRENVFKKPYDKEWIDWRHLEAFIEMLFKYSYNNF